MATISTTVSSSSGSSTARCTLTVTYSVSNTSPTATTVTSATLTTSAISVSGGTSMTQATARSNLVTTMIATLVELTFGGNRVAQTAGVVESKTVTFSGNNSVAKGHSATTSQLKLTALGTTATANISVPVKTSYTVKYNANSGSSAPSNQTKWHDETLEITSGEPKKTGYTFRGWSTTAARAGTADIDFVAGRNYTVNQGLDLYAVWELTYQKPTIYNVQIDRCQQDGTRDADGGYALVKFNWSVFNSTDTRYYGAPSGSDTPYANNTAASSTVTVGNFTATATLTANGGTAIVGDGSFNADTAYDASISLTDSQQIVTTLADHTTTVTDALAKANFPIDINEDATAIAFLTTAPDTGEGAFFGKNVDAPSYSVSGTALIDFFYPVGSYYETSDTSFNPNTTWVGTTWVKELAGQVHVSEGTGYSVGGALTNTSDGGSPYIQAHTHVYTRPTVSSSGAVTNGITGGPHSHTLDGTGSSVAKGTNYTRTRSAGTATANQYYTTSTTHTHNLPNHTHTLTGGGIGAVNGLPTGQTTGNAGNMQPYIVVNRWHRTA